LLTESPAMGVAESLIAPNKLAMPGAGSGIAHHSAMGPQTGWTPY
jgi:hypothetical protein